MPSQLAFVLLAFLLGLILGSFLNVIMSRVPRGESIIRPRSRCPGCGHPIRWFDNVPLLSFVLLRARCRDCKRPIPWRYPLVELAAGLWFLVLAVRLQLFLDYAWNIDFGLPPSVPAGVLQAAALAILGLLLIALLVIDWQHHRLPDALTFPGILAGFLFTCAQAALLPTGANDLHFDPRRNLRLRSPGSFIARGDVFLTGTERLIFGRIAAIAAAALILLAIRWLYHAVRHRQGLGVGDAKLVATIAAFLGLWPAVLALFLGTLLGGIYAVALLVRGRGTAATELPFGSFLAGGGLFAALWGPNVIAWYRSLL